MKIVFPKLSFETVLSESSSEVLQRCSTTTATNGPLAVTSRWIATVCPESVRNAIMMSENAFVNPNCFGGCYAWLLRCTCYVCPARCLQCCQKQHMQMVPSLQHLAGSCCDGAQHSACYHKSQSLWELLLQIPTRGNCFHKFQLVGIAFINSNLREFYYESQVLWELLLQIPTRGNCYYKFQLVGMLLQIPIAVGVATANSNPWELLL